MMIQENATKAWSFVTGDVLRRTRNTRSHEQSNVDHHVGRDVAERKRGWRRIKAS